MKKILVSMLAVLAVSSSANAFFIEPFLGYAVSGKESGDLGSDDLKGMDYGARLGMTFVMFSLGVEYAKGTYEEDVSGGSEYDTTDLGITFAFDFPILLRLYATYFLDSSAEDDTNEVTGDGGYRVGVGYTGLPFVNINVEMVKRAYDKLEGGGSFDGEGTVTQIGLSVPLP